MSKLSKHYILKPDILIIFNKQILFGQEFYFGIVPHYLSISFGNQTKLNKR